MGELMPFYLLFAYEKTFPDWHNIINTLLLYIKLHILAHVVPCKMWLNIFGSLFFVFYSTYIQSSIKQLSEHLN